MTCTPTAGKGGVLAGTGDSFRASQRFQGDREGRTGGRPRISGVQCLVEQVDLYRVDASRKLDPKKRSALGQFMTPVSVAAFMASLFGENEGQDIQLLDAGAGVGSLTAATVQEFCRRAKHPKSIIAG